MLTSRRMASSPAPEHQPAARLPEREFLEVVARAPLLCIDLIAKDEAGRVLLGLRRNAPARGTWFVPGGRVRKNEALDAAYSRLAMVELGVAARRSQGRFLGVFEHFYEDNFRGLAGLGTHCIVLGYELVLDPAMMPPAEQHSEYRWWLVEELLGDAGVHEYSKDYFR